MDYATAEAASAARYAEWPPRPDVEGFIERYLERLSELVSNQGAVT